MAQDMVYLGICSLTVKKMCVMLLLAGVFSKCCLDRFS